VGAVFFGLGDPGAALDDLQVDQAVNVNEEHQRQHGDKDQNA
jgi:hypothetical protein